MIIPRVHTEESTESRLSSCLASEAIISLASIKQHFRSVDSWCSFALSINFHQLQTFTALNSPFSALSSTHVCMYLSNQELRSTFSPIICPSLSERALSFCLSLILQPIS